MRPIRKNSSASQNPRVYYHPPNDSDSFNIKYKIANTEFEETYTYAQAKTTLYGYVQKEYNEQELTEQEKKRDEKLRGHLGRIYPKARADLWLNTGFVCNYCGIPVLTGSHVEHTLPKSWYPTYMVQWENFLYSCPSCNTIKSNKPSGDIDKLDDYIWPDLTDYEVLEWINYALIAVKKISSEANYRFPSGPKIAPNSLIKTLQQNTTYVEIDSESASVTIRTSTETIEVAVVPTSSNIESMTQTQRNATQQTIDELLGLNHYSGASDVGDRRMTERTLTWIWATQAIADLWSISYVSGISDSQRTTAHNLLIAQIKDSMQTSGFWAVWRSVLNSLTHILHKADYDEFIAFLNGFPGTDTSRT